MHHVFAHAHMHLLCMLLVHAWSACAGVWRPSVREDIQWDLTTLRVNRVAATNSFCNECNRKAVLVLWVLG